LREGALWSECIEKSVAMRLDSLMWGVLAAWLRRYFPLKFDRLRSKVWGMSSILMVLITTIGLTLRYQPGTDDFKAGPWDMFWFLGFNCGTALALPMFVSMNPVRNFIGSCVEKVSLWSYSMYLCHLPVMVLIAHNLPLKVRYSLPLTVVAIFAISAGLFYCFETPCTRLRDKFHKPLKAIRRTV
jgi:peptidoglycan/LPS O-acetylase OafA/YrhL